MANIASGLWQKKSAASACNSQSEVLLDDDIRNNKCHPSSARAECASRNHHRHGRRGRYHHKGFNEKPSESATQHCQTTAKLRKDRKPPSSSKNIHSLEIGNVNVTMAKSNAKLVQCAMEVKALGQATCFMSETHRVCSETNSKESWPEEANLGGCKFLNTELAKKAAAGVAILTSPEIQLVDRCIEFLNGQEMFALNTLFEVKKTSHWITYKLGRAMKRLNYFVADTWLRRCCINARAYPCRSGVFEFNHRMLMAEFKLPSRAQR